nr:MAG TPA: hypothetical protein [Caudoviricetes sp.]
MCVQNSERVFPKGEARFFVEVFDGTTTEK